MVVVFWLVFIVWVLVSVGLVAIILMQEPKQGGLGEGFGGGGGDFSTMSSTTSGLNRLTVVLGITWGVLSFALGLLPRA
jgi:preprotein translocase subunit SecG